LIHVLFLFKKNIEKRLTSFSIKIYKLVFNLDFISDFIIEKLKMNGKFKVDDDDIEELRKMPACAEYFLISLMRDISRFETNDVKIDETNLSKLEERIYSEHLNSYEIDEFLVNVKTYLSQNDNKRAFSELQNIHKKLRDLNIPKLFRLTRENNDALDKEVKGKNIYLFIGLSGTGIFNKHSFIYIEMIF
jgi:signal recognition particle GTPase